MQYPAKLRMVNTKCGISRGLPLPYYVLEDDTWGSLTNYAILSRMDSGAAQEELIKKLRMTIFLYDKVIEDQEKTIRKLQVNNYFILQRT
jgi:Mor family transcriptional regulator